MGIVAPKLVDPSTGNEQTASTTYSGTEVTSLAYTNSFAVLETTIKYPQFTGSQYTYLTQDGQSLVSETTVQSSNNATGGSVSQITETVAQNNVTDIITGSSHTGATTTSTPAASNTVPCNNYAEFCSRRYSNITQVCAHNSAFSVKNNAASNQVLDIVDQLNDGVRMSIKPDWSSNG